MTRKPIGLLATSYPRYPKTLTRQVACTYNRLAALAPSFQDNATLPRHAWIFTWLIGLLLKSCYPTASIANPRIGSQAWHRNPRSPSFLASSMATTPQAGNFLDETYSSSGLRCLGLSLLIPSNGLTRLPVFEFAVMRTRGRDV